MPEKPVMSMITRGRRAYGEGWRKVNITPDPDTGAYLIDSSPTEAPADQKPIFVPGLGNISTEMADFMLERSRADAAERAKKPKQSEKEVWEEVNNAWHDFVAHKLKRLKGESQFGPSGNFQRDR